MDPADLERDVDRIVAGLPAIEAPATLLPRVMRAIAAEPAPLPSWFDWPWPARVASAVAGLVVAAGLVFGWPWLAGQMGSLSGIARETAAWWNASAAIVRGFQPIAVGLAALVAVMGAVCATCGAALRDVALGGSSS